MGNVLNNLAKIGHTVAEIRVRSQTDTESGMLRQTHTLVTNTYTPFHFSNVGEVIKKGKGSPYSITERRVPELIPVLGSQPAGDVSHKPGGPPGPQLPSQPLRGLISISLLGEQRHDGCEQFAYDCYQTASRLRFEPRPYRA